MAWLGLLCIGAAPAFINYNLEGTALLHCLNVCETPLLIVDEDVGCQKRIEGSRKAIEERGTKTIILSPSLKKEITSGSKTLPGDKYRKGMEGGFPTCLIFTRYV